jgi:hypothetical protein
MVLLLSAEYLERNLTVFAKFRAQYIPDFFVEEHFGLRNTTWSKDLASGPPHDEIHCKINGVEKTYIRY